MPTQATTAHEAATITATLDRLVGSLIERDIDEYVRQFKAGRTSIGPKLRALGFDPSTGQRLATSSSAPPRAWSDGRRRRTLDRHERITSTYQETHGGRPLPVLKAPPATKIYVPSAHR